MTENKNIQHILKKYVPNTSMYDTAGERMERERQREGN
jgi:hypothetical protein